MIELEPIIAVAPDGEDGSPVTSTRTVFEDNGDSLYTILRRINNHLPSDIVEGFPWCAGTFQDRSLPANDTVILTAATDTQGKTSLIQGGNRFVADSYGLWICLMSGGIFSVPSTMDAPASTTLWKNSVTFGNENMLFGNTRTVYSSVPFISWGWWLDANDYVVFAIQSALAQSSFNTQNTKTRFAFARVA